MKGERESYKYLTRCLQASFQMFSTFLFGDSSIVGGRPSEMKESVVEG